MTQALAEAQGSAVIPEAQHRIEPTSQSKLDEALAILEDHKQEWASLAIDERERGDFALALRYVDEGIAVAADLGSKRVSWTTWPGWAWSGKRPCCASPPIWAPIARPWRGLRRWG